MRPAGANASLRPMFTAVLQILGGLVALILGAEALVRGAVWIALRLGISPMTVGLTLVAFGTSAPELMVSLEAAREGRAAIAVSNVLGSNVANVLLIVGVAALIQRIRLEVDRLECWFMLLATALAAVPYLAGGQLGRPLGAAMLAMLVLFCWLLLYRERQRGRQPELQTRPAGGAARWAVQLGLIALGLLALKYGADWLITGSVTIAQEFGMSDALIGMTIVAIGTSLPELATTIVAARRQQPEIAVGNVLGSNVFNIGSVLGLTALVMPLPVDRAETGPLMVMTGVSAVALCLVLRTWSGVPRGVGLGFLLAWCGYAGWETWRTGAF